VAERLTKLCLRPAFVFNQKSGIKLFYLFSLCFAWRYSYLLQALNFVIDPLKTGTKAEPASWLLSIPSMWISLATRWALGGFVFGWVLAECLSYRWGPSTDKEISARSWLNSTKILLSATPIESKATQKCSTPNGIYSKALYTECISMGICMCCYLCVYMPNTFVCRRENFCFAAEGQTY